jgi:hypothetical protein
LNLDLRHAQPPSWRISVAQQWSWGVASALPEKYDIDRHGEQTHLPAGVRDFCHG